MKIHKLEINTKTKKYPIYIGSNLISNINRLLSHKDYLFLKH